MKPLCIYHGNCADGFGAAWVVRHFFKGEVDFHAGVYGSPPPDVTDRAVICVDFSFKWEVLEHLARQSRGVLVLDHHMTAAEDLKLANYAGADWIEYQAFTSLDAAAEIAPSLYAAFDMERSGAGLTWDFFFPHVARPALIDRIEDRDLWRFAFPNTRAVQAAVFSYPYDFEVWDRLFEKDLSELAADGEAIERKHFKDIDELTAVVTRRMNIGGYNVPVANLPYTLTSDAGSKLAQGEPFAGCYWDTPTGRVFSLRSLPHGIDVADIASRYGGGGHRNAAGFRLSFERASELEIGYTNADKQL